MLRVSVRVTGGMRLVFVAAAAFESGARLMLLLLGSIPVGIAMPLWALWRASRER